MKDIVLNTIAAFSTFVKDHFPEILLFIVLLTMLGFTTAMSHVHNDSLASKGTEFAGQALAALLTLMVSSKKMGTQTESSGPAPDKEKQ